MRTLATAALFAPFLCCLVPAASPAAEVTCHASALYVVAEQEYANETGARFAATALNGTKAPATCSFATGADVFTIGSPSDPLGFSSLEGKMLVLTRSTGPDGSLVVYDLSTHRKVLDVPASDDLKVVGNKLSYWERVAQATEKTCPQFAKHKADGFGSVIARRRLLDLSTGKTADTGERRCDATQ